ncbi:MAG: hypothetical protein LBV20_02465 [Treponema sp.]|jgi:hypothetical protein|nr:hypothetical protein [Treponema sp.]
MGKKYLILIVLGITMYSLLFSEGFSFENRRYMNSNDLSFVFKDETFSYRIQEYEQYGKPGLDKQIPITITGSYIIKNVANNTIIEVDFPEGKRDIYVFNESRHIILYDTYLKRIFYGTDILSDESFIYPVNGVKATSYFTEILGGKEVKYTPDNLSDSDITNPWVEGVDGYGIGEVLHIGRYDNSRGIYHLLIMNGFFSPNQPELYLDNGRIKKVMMRGYDKEGRLTYGGIKELEDTPNLQLLTSVVPCVEFELEILEVYPGRRFEDTAVSGIFHDGLRYMQEMNLRE